MLFAGRTPASYPHSLPTKYGHMIKTLFLINEL